MLNNVVLVGRLTDDPLLNETNGGVKVSNITLAINRSFKNKDGKYDADFIRATLWKDIAENTVKYIHKGDIIGVIGRIQNNKYKDKDGNDQYSNEIVADKVVFVSSKREGGE